MEEEKSKISRAIIIDDSPVDRRVIGGILSSLGIDSIEVENGERAYAALVERPEVDLVFIDWNMPVLNGIDLTRRIRAEERFRELTLIMITAATGMEDIIVALEAGVDEYVMKPIDRQMLFEKLKLVGVQF